MNKRVFNWCLVISFLVILFIITIVYFYFKGPKEVVWTKKDGGNISLTYTDEFNGLTIKNCVPLKDNVGMTLNRADMFFDFSITTEVIEADKMDYEISIKKDSGNSTTVDENIKVYLEEEVNDKYSSVFGPSTYTESTEKTKLGTPKGNMVLYKVTKKANSTDKYRLRVWLSDTAVFDKKAVQNISVKVFVNGKAS